MQPRLSILVVDDEADLRVLLRLTLERPEYEVREASSGPEALRLCAEAAPDVLLLDIMMPGMDGYEVCRRVRAEPGCARTRIVLITADDQATQRARAAESGADRFVAKPFSPLALLEVVRELAAR